MILGIIIVFAIFVGVRLCFPVAKVRRFFRPYLWLTLIPGVGIVLAGVTESTAAIEWSLPIGLQYPLACTLGIFGITVLCWYPASYLALYSAPFKRCIVPLGYLVSLPLLTLWPIFGFSQAPVVGYLVVSAGLLLIYGTVWSLRNTPKVEPKGPKMLGCGQHGGTPAVVESSDEPEKLTIVLKKQLENS